MHKVDLALDFPVILNHLPTKDHGIHFGGVTEAVLEKIIYNYGKLDSLRTAAQDEDWYVYKRSHSQKDYLHLLHIGQSEGCSSG